MARPLAQALFPANGLFSISGGLSAAGATTYTAFVTNNVGTDSPVSPPLDVLIDTAAPVVTVDSLLTAHSTPTITGTVTDSGGSNLADLKRYD